jgi:CspA family cold shock protein
MDNINQVRQRGKIGKWMKGFGFVQRENEKDIFVHASQLSGGLTALAPGDIVEFTRIDTERGPQANNVMKVGGGDGPVRFGGQP